MKSFLKHTRPVWVVLGVAAVFLLSYCIISAVWRDDSPKPAPEITGVLADGASLYSLSENRGVGTLLVFFDPETGKAADLMAQLSALAPDYPKADIFAVCTGAGTVEELRAKLRELGIAEFPHLVFDVRGEMAKTYNVHGTPVTYLIDKNGMVIDAYIGSISEKSLKKALERLS